MARQPPAVAAPRCRCLPLLPTSPPPPLPPPALTPPCCRVAYEGLPFLLPHVTKQLLELPLELFERLITERNVPLPLVTPIGYVPPRRPAADAAAAVAAAGEGGPLAAAPGAALPLSQRLMRRRPPPRLPRGASCLPGLAGQARLGWARGLGGGGEAAGASLRARGWPLLQARTRRARLRAGRARRRGAWPSAGSRARPSWTTHWWARVRARARRGQRWRQQARRLRLEPVREPALCC
jgi:hypothetical protein